VGSFEDCVGNLVGSLVGNFVGDLVGSLVGDIVGGLVGSLVGYSVGFAVGAFVGVFVGGFIGYPVGSGVALLGDFVRGSVSVSGGGGARFTGDSEGKDCGAGQGSDSFRTFSSLASIPSTTKERAHNRSQLFSFIVSKICLLSIVNQLLCDCADKLQSRLQLRRR
jgi:hypothetical protein